MHFTTLEKEINTTGTRTIERIKKAYIFAKKAHEGQKRKTGEDYITHPVAVAKKLIHMGADEESIIAALLHDTVEDTNITLQELEKEFGGDVAKLVDGLTKFEKKTFEENRGLDEKIETIRKWMTALKKDLRIAIIKIADRLDNLSSLGVFRPEKRMRIAQETLDIYARVAKWLSLEEIRQELEHYSFPHILSTEQYEDLEKRMEKTEKQQKKNITSLQKKLTQSAPRSFSFSLQEHLISVQEVYFSSSLPIGGYCIVPSKEDCYLALFLFHKHWHRKKGSFQDYINSPKINGYKALHTTLVLEGGKEIKIKIMTKEMFEYYKRGVLTFCFDKKKEQKQLPWIAKMQQLLKTNREKSYNFWQGIQSDLLTGFIVVYGPKGNSITLPQNSTYLDAVFEFLHEKALYVSSIFSDGKQIPQRRQITDGSRIEYIQEKSPQVEYSWLQDVDNMQSIEIIKKFLKKQKQKEKIASGKAILQAEFDAYDMGMVDELQEKNILVTCKDLEIHSLHELFIKIAEVYILPSEVVARIAPEKIQDHINDKEIFFVTCEVRNDCMAEFWNIVSLYIKKSQVSSIKSNKKLFLVQGKYHAPYEKKQEILRDIRRTKGMRILSLYEKRFFTKKIIFLFILLTLLWGLDPVFASLLLHDTHITPSFLVITRFIVMSSVFAIFLGIQNVFSKSIPKKEISFFSPHIFILGFALFGVAICTYNALVDTRPSEYSIVLYPWFMIFSLLLFSPNRKVISSHIGLLSFIFFLFLLAPWIIFHEQGWPLGGKLWTIGAAFSFLFYSFASTLFQKKYTIFSRYISYQFFISLYAALFSLILFFFIQIPVLSLSEYALTIGFHVIFTALAFLLFSLLLKSEKSSLMGPLLLAIIPVTVFGEWFVLGAAPSLHILVTIGTLLIGVFALFLLQKNKKQEQI